MTTVKMPYRYQILCCLLNILVCCSPAAALCAARTTLYNSKFCQNNRDRSFCRSLQRALAADCEIYQCPGGVPGPQECDDPPVCPNLFTRSPKGIYCLGDACCYANATSCEDFPRGVDTVMVHIQHEIGVPVVCDDGWTIIQRRTSGVVSFDRTYAEYEDGFGDPGDGYWLGLKHIRSLLERGTHQIRFDFNLGDGTPFVAQYRKFNIGPAHDGYRLSIHHLDYDYAVSTAAGRSIEAHNGRKFTTKDRDQDLCPLQCNCAFPGRGGWWYHSCATANLNGRWSFRRFNWGTSWLAESGLNRPLSFTEVKIRLAS